MAICLSPRAMSLFPAWMNTPCMVLVDFEQNDGVPVLLKALLFDRFDYWSSGTPTEFKMFYNSQW